MYGCESWSIKKAECQRIDAFELWCWRKLLRVPWTARRSKQAVQKEMKPEYSLEGLMLKLKLQSFGKEPTHWKSPWCWERLKAGGEGATEDEMVGWHHWLNGHEFEKTHEIVEDRWAWRAIVHEVTESRTRLSDCTTTMIDSLALFTPYNLHIVKMYFLTKYRSLTEITGHTAQFCLCIAQESSQ